MDILARFQYVEWIFSHTPVPSRLQILRDDHQHQVVVWDNLMVIFWHGVPSPAVCRSLYDLALRWAKQQGATKVSAVSVLDRQRADPPSPEVREALTSLHRDPRGIVYRTASVAPDVGFLAATVRSVILGILQRTSRRFTKQHEVFPTLEAAVTWAADGLLTASGEPIQVEPMLQELKRLTAKPSSPRVA